MYSLDKACDTVEDMVDNLEIIVQDIKDSAKKERSRVASDLGDPFHHAARADIMLRIANSLADTAKKLGSKAEMLKLIEDYLDGEVDGDFFECMAVLHFHSNKEEKQ